MVRSVAFTSDCQKLITVSDDQIIKIIDLGTLTPLITFSEHKGNINQVDISPTNNK